MKPRHLSNLHILFIGSLALLPLASVQAQTTGNWNYNGTVAASNSWNTVASWLNTSLTGGVVPNAIGATPNFLLSTTNGRTITLDGDRTVGTMSIDDPSSAYVAYTFSAGTPSTSQLIFDVASGSAALNTPTAANTQTNLINVGITLNDPLVITTTRTNVTGGLNLAGVISDGASSYAITKSGNGAVTFGAANTYDGGTTISAGRIVAANAASFGTGAVVVNSGGQAHMSTAATFDNDFNIAGNGYSNTADQGALNGAIRYQNSITSGTVNLTANARIGAFGGTSGTIAGPLTGGLRDLEINSTTNASHNGNIFLTGNAAGLTGTVTVSQGTLRLGTNSNLGGSVAVRDNANLYGDNIGTPGGAALAGNLTLGNTTGANFYIDPSTDDALLVSGNLTLNGTNTVILSGPVTSSSVVVMNFAGTLTGSDANLTLPGGLAAYRDGTGFTTTGNQIKLNVVLGEITWTGAASSNWNTTDINWTDGSPTPFFNLDTVAFNDTAATIATFTTNLANANNDLVFTAVASGAAGEAVTIEYLNPGVADSPLGVTVTGNAISVSLETDSLSAIISTASDVLSAIESSGPASALVMVALAASNDGSGLVAALSATSLALANPTINLATGVTVSPGDMTFDHSAIDYTVSGSGAIAGGGSLTKSGTGILTLSTANSFAGGTAGNGGTIRVGNASAFGSGTLTLTAGQLSSDSTTARTLANPLNLSGSITLGDGTATGALTFSGATTLGANTTLNCGAANTVTHSMTGVITDGSDSFRLTKSGTAHLLLSAVNTYDGGTTIESSRIQASNLGCFGTGTVKVLSGGQAFFSVGGTNTNDYEIEGTGWTEPSGNLGAIRVAGNTLSGSITLTGDARITAHGTTGTLAGNIGETGGSWGLELSNYNTGTDSTITVTGDNSYSGGTTVKGAIVIANHNNALGTGPVTLESNGTAARITRVQLGTDVVINNDITINSNAQTGFRGAVHSYAGSLATPSLAIVNGDIEIQGAMGNGGHLAAEASSLSVLRVMGAVNVTNATIPLVRVGTVELGGGGNYTEITHGEGTLKLAAANGINPAAVVNLGLSGASVFDLNGFDQTLTGLTKGSFNATVTNNGASPSTLTLNPAGASTYAGTFADGSSELNLVKTGAGTLTLSGNSGSFTDSLSVTEGTVNLTGTLGGAGAAASFGANTTLSGEGTFGGDLTLSGATLDVNGSTPLGILATGTLTTSGGVNVNLQSLPATPGPIEVIAFGTLAGSVGDFTCGPNFRSPVFSLVASTVSVTLGAPVDLTWTGTGGSDWDINTTSNWNNPSLVPSTFLFADNVTFGNTGGGTIGVPANVSASNLVLNSNDNWLFQGTGTVAAGAVTKDGTGTATVENPVDFSGTIALTAGVLRLSPPTGVTSTLAGTIDGAGTLAKGGEGSLSISGTNAGFTGALVIAKGEVSPGNSSALGSASITFGDATTTPTDICRLTLGTGLALTNTPITVADTCLDARITSTGSTINGTAITKKGPGKLTIGHATSLASTANVLTGASSITIEAGTLAGSSQKPISASTTITMGNANTGTAPTIVELPANQTTANDVVTLECPLVLSPNAPNSEAIFRYPGGTSQGSLSFSGAISLNGRDIYIENTSNVNTPSRLYNVTGVISGNGSVRMRGNSGTTIRVQANSTYTGDLYMLSGRIQTAFNTTGGESIPNTARIIMSAGASVGLANTAETIRGLVGGAATETVTTSALINQGRGDNNLCRLTVSDSNAANTHVFDGRIENRIATAPIALTKAGAATQVLNGPCSFTGSTELTGGKLVINNTYASAITVSADATLGGNMTSTAAITATAAGAKVAPGNSTGTMTAASANLSTGGVLEMEIDDSSTPKSDKLAVTGILNITGATLNLTLTGAPSQPAYVLASYGTLTGTFGTVNKPTGLAAYDVVYNYNDGLSTNNIALVLNYAGWLAGYPALTGANRAPGVDFDGDGLDNGIEFVIGSNPSQVTGAATPGYPKATVTGGNLVFTFNRGNSSKLYPVTVETSLDLVTWPPANAYLIPTTDTAGPPVTVSGESVTVTIPMAPDAKKFARVKAAIPFTP